MKKFLVTRNVVIETAEALDRYVIGQMVEVKATEAKRLNKMVNEPFLEALPVAETIEEGMDSPL